MSLRRRHDTPEPSRWRFRPDRALGRKDEVRRLQRYLLQSSHPRLQMCLLVALTGAAGLLASWLLLAAGMTSMAARYPTAVAVAYLAFLALLWLWMRTTQDEIVENLGDAFDAAASLPRGTRASDAPASSTPDPSSGNADGLGFEPLELAAADEVAIPLALLALLVAVCASLLLVLASVVWSAPVLFAEVLFDGVLAAGLYRRLRRADAQHWLQSALRHTFWPFVLTAAFAALAGFALHHFAPDAITLSQALASSR